MLRPILSCVCVCFSIGLIAQVSIMDTNASLLITFDTTFSGINQGVFDGSGLVSAPTTGQLNSNGIRVRGLSTNSSFDFGDDGNSGDFIKGQSAGGVSSGGLYAFEVDAGDYAVGFQGTGSDWTPGSMTIKVDNNTASIISEVLVSYDVYWYNDASRSQRIEFSYSEDDVTYTQVPSTLLFTDQAASTPTFWSDTNYVVTISGLNLMQGESLYLQWDSDDASGSGSRDEIAFDNIEIEVIQTGPAPATCAIDTIYAQNVSMCMDAGTPTDPSDDYFLADVTIEIDSFADPTDTLFVFYGSNSMPTHLIPVTSMDSVIQLIGDTFIADGSALDVSVSLFVDHNCNYTEVGAIPAVSPCSQPVFCQVDTIYTIVTHTCHDNGTPNNITDDYFIADVRIEIDTLLVSPDTMYVFYGSSITPAHIVPHVFTDTMVWIIGDTFAADGMPLDVRVEFAGDSTCTYTGVDALPGISNCSQYTCPSAGDLLMTEIMADPTDVGDADGEYIELYNRSNATIDLLGMELFDLGIDNHVIGSSIIVEPDSFVVLGRSGTVPGAAYIYTDIFLGNNDDDIFLRCADSASGMVVITGIDYDDGNIFGSGVAQEITCLTTPLNILNQSDLIAATDVLDYDADADVDAGSPGSAGNTIVQTGAPAFVDASVDASIVSNASSFDVVVCITDSMGVIPCGMIDSIDLISSDSILVSIAVSPQATTDNGCVTFTATPSPAATCAVVELYAKSLLVSDVDTLSIEILDEMFSQNWDTCGDWSIFNGSGATTWACDTPGGYMWINAFGDTVASEDWLISPSFDLTTHGDVQIQFETQERFSGTPISLLVSTDYTGSGDPAVATWDTLAFTFDNSEDGFSLGPVTSSGLIDVSSFISLATSFAFVYDAPADSVAEWRVDNWTVIGCPKECIIDTIYASNITPCDSNMFTASVHVVYNDAPAQGLLVLSGDGVDTVDVMDATFISDSGVHVFDSVLFAADGGLKTVTASFTEAPSCALTTSLAGTDVAPCAGGASVFGGLVINEIWNDQSFGSPICFTSTSYIELLVVASIDEDTTTQFVNLQNWIIDPSNSATDLGHIRIKGGCLTSVPVGALIVIYNEDQPPAGVAADEMDSNGDLVYFIPSNSSCLEYSRTAGYPGLSYESGDTITDCFNNNLIAAASSGVPYTAETRHPHSFNRAYTDVYDDLTFDPSNSAVPSGSSGLICGNIDAPSAVGHDLLITPGTSNNADNDRLIEGVREEAGNSLTTPGFPNPDAINYAAFLADNGTADCDELFSSDCLDTLIVTTLGMSDTLYAQILIETDGSVIVDGDVLFSAPEILLQPGFEVPLGHTFTTDIDGCLTISVLRGESAGGDFDEGYFFPSLPLPAKMQGEESNSSISDR